MEAERVRSNTNITIHEESNELKNDDAGSHRGSKERFITPRPPPRNTVGNHPHMNEAKDNADANSEIQYEMEGKDSYQDYPAPIAMSFEARTYSVVDFPVHAEFVDQQNQEIYREPEIEIASPGQYMVTAGMDKGVTPWNKYVDGDV